MSIVHLQNVDLIYELKKDNYLFDLFKKRNKRVGMTIHALKDLSLELKDGDRLGIIGHNGAGKSSLLKTIAGIYPPTSGELVVEGRVATLFELATGFEMEATGWDNIYLRGLMLGETPKGIREKRQEIADFSELGAFLHIPVKYYSSGMFMRLAFSVSTAIEPDILLLDEVIAAGDAKFLEKSKHRISELVGKVKILVFVTHSMDSLRSFCNKAIWLDHGNVVDSGDVDNVIQHYLASIK